MSKTPLGIFFVLFSFCSLNTDSVYSQFINIQINIEPELSTTVERNLDFGSLVSNVGEQVINLGDLNTGIFNIRAIYTQSLYLELVSPSALNHINPAIPDQIPLDLKLAYNNRGVNNQINSTILENNVGFVPVASDLSNKESSGQIWRELYVYVFGSVFVGEITNGDYTGTISLFVDYD